MFSNSGSFYLPARAEWIETSVLSLWPKPSRLVYFPLPQMLEIGMNDPGNALKPFNYGLTLDFEPGTKGPIDDRSFSSSPGRITRVSLPFIRQV